MVNHLNNIDVVTDFGGFEGLRARARSDGDSVLKEVASQFESLFVQMMLKSMRDAKLADGIFDSQQSEMYSSVLDQQLSVDLSRAGGLGLAEMMVRQLSPKNPQSASSPVQQEPLPKAEVSTLRRLPASSKVAVTPVPVVNAPKLANEPDSFKSPSEFVKTLWPHAQSAAKELGVAPEALLAQTALETGWGKSIIRDARGSSSHNLFNIKADGRWPGDRVAKTTVEFRDGLPNKERASFRAYSSYAESFSDYVGFLKGSARYDQALSGQHQPENFARELQDAGYATDPRYADKISDILKRPEFSEVIASLKLGVGSPIT